MPTASQSDGRRVARRDPVQDLVDRVHALPRRQVGIPCPDLGDDLAVALLGRRVGPDRGRIVERARVEVVGRAPDEAVRDADDEHGGLRVRQHVAAGLVGRRRRLRSRLGAGRDVLAQRFLAQELPERVGHAAEVRLRVLADRLDRRVEEDVVVLVRGRVLCPRAR